MERKALKEHYATKHTQYKANTNLVSYFIMMMN